MVTEGNGRSHGETGGGVAPLAETDGHKRKVGAFSFLSQPSHWATTMAHPSDSVTLTAHFMTSAVSSDTTRSTHLRLGSFSLRICFLTMASKARSGVKSPVLETFRGWWGWRVCFCCSRREEGETRTARKKKGKEEGKKEAVLQLVVLVEKKRNQTTSRRFSHPLFQPASSSTVN